MSIILFIAIGGFFGAITRFVLSKKFNRPQGTFPIGTLIANVSGSFLLGILLGSGIEGNLFALFGVGFLGSCTTFSTIFLEFILLIQNHQKLIFYAYFVTSYILGISFAFTGFVIGRGFI